MSRGAPPFHGRFYGAHHLGSPIWVALELTNSSRADVYTFLPRGRADGIDIEVKSGRRGVDYIVKDLTEEPEGGLVAETRIGAGDSLVQHYRLTDWIAFQQPGVYVIRLSAAMDANAESIRIRPDPRSNRVLIEGDMTLVILGKST
jgi:hypothetical protein